MMNLNIPNTSTYRDLLVHTDPINDIDDEMAAGDLVRFFIETPVNYNIRLTFSVKTNRVDRLIDYGTKPFAGLDLDPNVTTTIQLESGYTLSITFRDGTVMLPLDYAPHYILCIAPGLDSILTEANLVNLRGFSHQGLPGSWKGFNDNGSVGIISAMMNKGVPHAITTPFESFAKLFGVELFEEYKIPQSVWDQIARDAFKMIMGRMPPTVPASVLPMAETLVNIPYAESIGKPSTNSRLALAIRKKTKGRIHPISPEHRQQIRSACVAYVDSLDKAAAAYGTPSPVKHRDQTIESLDEMTIALAEMGMPSLDESGTRLIYSSDGDLAAKYPEAFEEFKKIGIFTPAYDMVAARKLYPLLKADGVV